MLVVKHPTKPVWILLECVLCDDEAPRAMFVDGLGSVIPSYDNEIRIFAPKGTPREQYRKLFDESMDHHREKRLRA